MPIFLFEVALALAGLGFAAVGAVNPSTAPLWFGLAVLCGVGAGVVSERGRRWLSNRLSSLAGRIAPGPVLETHGDSATWRRATDVLLTWVYRRKNWPGLSTEGRFTEGAHENYGQDIYDRLELDARYRRAPTSAAEPDFDGDAERAHAELVDGKTGEEWRFAYQAAKAELRHAQEQLAHQETKASQAGRALTHRLAVNPVAIGPMQGSCTCGWRGYPSDWEAHRKRAL